MQARLVELKSNKALNVPKEKHEGKKKTPQLENGKQNLTFRKVNLVFQNPSAEIIHILLLSIFPSYNIQTRILSHYSQSIRNAETFWYGSHFSDILCLFLRFQWFITIYLSLIPLFCPSCHGYAFKKILIKTYLEQ